MKIKEIEIYGYGKWMDQTFQLGEGLHLFYGGNEAGKTTLMSFIHSILFGFPHRQSSELRYEPKTGSRYGGKLTLEDPRYGQVTVERVKGKASGEVTVFLEDGRTGSDELLNELLYGMDKEWYQSIFSFNLDGVQHIERMTKEKLNRYFLSAGTLGTEQFLKEADRLHTMASKLYKPTGRVPDINKKMKEVESKGRRVEAAKKKNSQYVELVNEKQSIQQNLEDIRETLKQTDETLARLRQMEREWDRFDELRSLQLELGRSSAELLPEDGLHQLNHFNNELEELRTKEIQEQEKIHQYQKTYRPSKLLDFYQKNEEQFNAMQEELEEVRVKLVTLDQLSAEEEDLKQRVLKEKLRLGLNPIADMPEELTEKERTALSQQAEEEAQLEKNLEDIKNRLSLLEYRRHAISEEIDGLETKLWTNADFEETKKKLEQQRESTPPRPVENGSGHQGGMNKALMAAGAVSAVGSFFLTEPLSWLVLAAGIALLIFGMVSRKKRNKTAVSVDSENADQSGTHSYEEYIKQTEIRKTWRTKLAESDETEETLRTIEEERKQNQRDKQELWHEWKKVREEKGYPDIWTIEETVQKEPELHSLRQDESQLHDKRRKISNLLAYLENWKDSLSVIQDELSLESSLTDVYQQVKRLFRSVKEEEQRQQEYIERFKEAHRELERLIQEIKKAETKKRRLLRAVQADTEEDFRKKYAQQEEMKQKRARFEWLASQLDESVEEFEAFKSKDELLETIKGKEAHIRQLKEEEEHQTNAKIQREVDIRKLEEGGDYAVLLQEYENTKSELQVLVDEWASLKVAANLIERTLNYAKKDRLPATIADAETFFVELTDGNYTRIHLEDDAIKVRHRNHLVYDASELSRGTAEQLYVALRLAFIKNIKDAMQLPVLVDDGFVNFDPERKRRMWSLIERLSETTQVLYFTFDDEAKEDMHEACVTVL